MKIRIWTLTTDGDNCPIDTKVFATKREALDCVIAGIWSFNPTIECQFKSAEKLSEIWEEVADGACIIEEHEIEVKQEV